VHAERLGGISKADVGDVSCFLCLLFFEILPANEVLVVEADLNVGGEITDGPQVWKGRSSLQVLEH